MEAALAGLPGLVTLPYAFYAGIRLTFSNYAIVLDGERAIPSLRKSWRLTQGHLWTIFEAILALGFAIGALSLLVGLGITLSLVLVVKEATLALFFVVFADSATLFSAFRTLGLLVVYEMLKPKAQPTPLKPATQPPRPPLRPPTPAPARFNPPMGKFNPPFKTEKC